MTQTSIDIHLPCERTLSPNGCEATTLRPGAKTRWKLWIGRLSVRIISKLLLYMPHAHQISCSCWRYEKQLKTLGKWQAVSHYLTWKLTCSQLRMYVNLLSSKSSYHNITSGKQWNAKGWDKHLLTTLCTDSSMVSMSSPSVWQPIPCGPRVHQVPSTCNNQVRFLLNGHKTMIA